MATALAARFAWVGIEAGPTERYTVGVVAWCFALGWLASRAQTVVQKIGVVAAVTVGCVGSFGDTQRELLVIGSLATLAWVTTVRLPRPVDRALGVLAASSLFVYLTHWQVYPDLEMDYPLLATLASFAVGIAYWQLMRPFMRLLGRALRSAKLLPTTSEGRSISPLAPPKVSSCGNRRRRASGYGLQMRRGFICVPLFGQVLLAEEGSRQ